MILGDLFALEAMMRQFMKNMSKEDKQRMMQEFMNSMTEDERTQMIQLMMPIMMKNMKPNMMMANMMKNFDGNECKKMMMEMAPEMREKCRKMMTTCLKDCEQMEKATERFGSDGRILSYLMRLSRRQGSQVNVEIFPFSLGFNDCYVIRDQGVIMIDAGVPDKKTDFVRAMKSIRMESHDIKLIVITHGHPDHIGSAKDIKEITGARIAMHQLDKVCLETGEWNTTAHKPKGTGFWSSIGAGMFSSIVGLRYSKVATCNVDVTVDDAGADLADYGIHGRVVYTPGHTIGSLSVLLDSGEAFVGDLAMNKLPLRHNPGLPVLADDMEKVRESWRKLLKLGVTTVYPGHGKPFSVEVIEKALK